MHCNKVSFQELLDCFDNDLGNNADNLEHNAEKLREILNRIMQRTMSIITSALSCAMTIPSKPDVHWQCGGLLLLFLSLLLLE